MEAQSFEEWWKELKVLAAESEWTLGDKDTYKEFFDDGDTPAAALDLDLETCDDGDDE